MRTILILFRKDFANFARDKAALSLTFIVPVALIYIFGHVFGLNRKDSGPTGIRLGIVNQSGDPATEKLIAALKAEKAFRVVTTHVDAAKSERPLTEDDVRAQMHNNQLRFAVVIPPDFVRQGGVGIRLKILSNPRNDIETQTVNGLLQKTIFSSAPELLGQSLQAQARRAIGSDRLGSFNRSIADAVSSASAATRPRSSARLKRATSGCRGSRKVRRRPRQARRLPALRMRSRTS